MDAHTNPTSGDWDYNWSGAPRPFVHPVRTPGGRVLSVDSPPDHPWHHALWFTIKYVNGENFWEEFDEYGLLVQHDPPVTGRTPGGSITASSTLEWHRPGPEGPGTGEVVVDQSLLLTRNLHEDASSMDWDVRLTPRVDVTLDRTPFTTWGGYGGLTFRGRSDWHDTQLLTDSGSSHQRLLGDRSRWCALLGPLGAATGDAEHVAGLAMFDHPQNPFHPVPWYASTRADTYGTEGWSNFANAAVLWDGPMDLAAGETLRLRYRVCTFDGERDTAWIDRHHQEWSAAGGSGDGETEGPL